MQELLDIIRCMDVMDESYDKIKSLTKEGFMIFIGNLVDQYGADHGLDSLETCQMFDDIATVQKMVHAEVGAAKPVA